MGRHQLSSSQGMLRPWTLFAIYTATCGPTVPGSIRLRVLVALSLSECFSPSTSPSVLRVPLGGDPVNRILGALFVTHQLGDSSNDYWLCMSRALDTAGIWLMVGVLDVGVGGNDEGEGGGRQDITMWSPPIGPGSSSGGPSASRTACAVRRGTLLFICHPSLLNPLNPL